MPKGYNGKILRLDLTRKKMSVEEPDEIFYRTYLGGGGLASYYLLKELPKSIDPLSGENLLIFSSAILAGTPIAGMSRFTVAAKSPLTGGYGEAEAGGFFGPELKFSGFDAVVVRGKAAKPSYLWIHDGQVELRSAEKIWGLETGPAQEKIREDLKERSARIALIGPAGEHLVRFACVISDLKQGSGRTGMGAVMGSKNLKAVAVQGTNRLELNDLERFLELSKDLTGRVVSYAAERKKGRFGSLAWMRSLNDRGLLSTGHFQRGVFSGIGRIAPETIRETVLEEEGCYACPLRCRRSAKSLSGPYAVLPEYGGPDNGALGALGPLLLIDDPEAVAKGSELCRRYGLDPVSTGAAIGFAMECFENGLLTEEETEGVKLRFGSAEAMLKAIEAIAFRRPGMGDILADGVKVAAAGIGRGAETYALHVKGQEVPPCDPRGEAEEALNFALSPTGADPLEFPRESFPTEAESERGYLAPLGLLESDGGDGISPLKVRRYLYLHFVRALHCSLGVCTIAGGPARALPLDKLVEVVEAATGWKTSLWELLKAGERAITMARIFNQREGWGRNQDTLPDRFFTPLPGGPLEVRGIDRRAFEEACSLYYEAMGWDRGRSPKPRETCRAEHRLERDEMLGISTSWLSETTESGREIIEAIADLGGEAVELDFRLSRSMFEEMRPRLRSKGLPVISLHNFFPVPEGIPRKSGGGDIFSLSSPDTEERTTAVRLTLRTLEWAEELEARAVVLHLGWTAMENPSVSLKRLYDDKKIKSDEGRAFIATQKKIRNSRSRVHLDAALRSLEALAEAAEKRSVSLGVENRYHLHEFPDIQELAVIFKEFSGSRVGFWFDIGHATAKQNLGIEEPGALLESFGDRLVGVHLHGCRGYRDHEAPGTGEEDYTHLKKFLCPETLRVVETHHRAGPEELRKGLKFLRQQEIDLKKFEIPRAIAYNVFLCSEGAEYLVKEAKS